MDPSLRTAAARLAVFVAAGLAVTAVSLAGDAEEGEPSAVEVKAKGSDVHRHLRGAEETLAKALRAADARAPSANDTAAAGASLAKLLAAAREDSRQASAAMQWLLDHAPA